MSIRVTGHDKKVISGKIYKVWGSYPKKSDAENRAFNLRIGNGRARIFKEGSYWVVYYRKGNKPFMAENTRFKRL